MMRRPVRLSTGCALVCRVDRFQAFLRSQGMQCRNEKEAAMRVREYCRIDSRAKLDTCPIAKAAWLRLLGAFNQSLVNRY